MVILYRWNRSALQFQVELRVFLNWRNIQRFWDDLEWIFQSFRLLHRSVKYYLKRYSLCISPRQSNQNIRQTVWHVLTYVCMYIYVCTSNTNRLTCAVGVHKVMNTYEHVFTHLPIDVNIWVLKSGAIDAPSRQFGVDSCTQIHKYYT